MNVPLQIPQRAPSALKVVPHIGPRSHGSSLYPSALLSPPTVSNVFPGTLDRSCMVCQTMTMLSRPVSPPSCAAAPGTRRKRGSPALRQLLSPYERPSTLTMYMKTAPNTAPATAPPSSGSSLDPITVWLFDLNKAPMVERMTMANTDTTMLLPVSLLPSAHGCLREWEGRTMSMHSSRRREASPWWASCVMGCAVVAELVGRRVASE